MKRKLTKRTIALAILLTLVLGAGIAVAVNRISDSGDDQASGALADQDQGIDYGPPTDEEIAEVDDHKDDLADQAANPAPQPSKNVTPTLVNAYYSSERSQMTISGFVTGILENGGTCTVEVTGGGAKVTKTATASANANSTDCPPFNIAKSEFPQSGTWTVVLKYSSATASGTSTTREVIIP